MDIKEIKKDIRYRISNWVRSEDKITPSFIRGKVRNIFKRARYDLDEQTKELIVDGFCDDFLGLGPLQKLMEDVAITEIMVNGPDRVYIEKGGKKVLTDVKFDDVNHLRYIIEKMLTPTGHNS